jgi:uncharacterized membrane protein YczE
MKKVYRTGIYLLGMLALVVGISLNAKTGLGVSPITSVAYCLAEIYDFELGDTLFGMYILFVLVQLVLRGRKYVWQNLFQLPTSLLFSRLLNFVDATISYSGTRHSLDFNAAMLFAAVVLIGVGVSMTVNMNIVPNPSDGIVQAIAQRVGWEQGWTKNVFDVSCVLLTSVISILSVQKIIGINIGTIVAMVCTGRVVSMTNRLFKHRMLRAAGLMEESV